MSDDMPGFRSKVRDADIRYVRKKLPSGLTVANWAGVSMSLAATAFIISLMVLDFCLGGRVKMHSELLSHRSYHTEGRLLRAINATLSESELSSEYAVVNSVSDPLGAGTFEPDLPDDSEWNAPLSETDFAAALEKYSIVMADFYAPWCPWSKRLGPIWDSAASDVHHRHPENESRIRLLKVDCTKEQQLCQQQQITSYPSIRVFRKYSNETGLHGKHESFQGSRTKASLLAFAEALVPSAGQAQRITDAVAHERTTPLASAAWFTASNLRGRIGLQLDSDIMDDTEWNAPLGCTDFTAALEKYSIVVANFYAPWCIHSQQLQPTWDSVATDIHHHYPGSARIRLLKVDCTKEEKLCEQQQITEYPSIRVYRKGSDKIGLHGLFEHESYRGSRTKASLLEFAEALVPSAGQPHRNSNPLQASPAYTASNLRGSLQILPEQKWSPTLYMGTA